MVMRTATSARRRDISSRAGPAVLVSEHYNSENYAGFFVFEEQCSTSPGRRRSDGRSLRARDEWPVILSPAAMPSIRYRFEIVFLAIVSLGGAAQASDFKPIPDAVHCRGR